MTPHKCPICEGRGTVACNFYSCAESGTSATPVQCKACSGSGYLWEPQPLFGTHTPPFRLTPVMVPPIEWAMPPATCNDLNRANVGNVSESPT